MTGEPPTAAGTALEQAFGCLKTGRVADAAALLAPVLEAEPENPFAHHLQGLVRLHQGRAADAAAHLERAVAGAPDHPDHHLNLGVALERLGRIDDAVGHYRQAASLNPDHAQAHANLGFAHRRQGDFGRALDAFGQALARDPGHTGAQLGFADVVGGIRAEAYSEQLERALVQAFGLSGCDVAELAPAAAHQLVLKHGLAGGDAGTDLIEALGDDPLFAEFLAKCVNTDPAMELALTGLRRRLLLDAGGGLSPAALRGAGLLARQCFINEYVFGAEDDEQAAVGGLKTRLEQALAEGAPTAEVREMALLYGLYGSLGDIEGAGRLATGDARGLGPELDRLLHLTVRDPAAERALADTIETAAAIADATSRAVQAQYEDNPYPRWLHAPDQQPQGLSEMLAAAFPHWTLRQFGQPLRVLIAGCGTGRQVVHVARTHRDAEIAAIDLSKASLAYAMRMTRELGISNVQFTQADVLDAARLGGPFDMIQSVGVLHHMQDPLAGWRALAGLLVPGGVMKIGLYSERGRRGVQAWRERIAAEAITPTPENIARFRRRLITDPPQNDTGGETGNDVGRILATPDFYSTSMCRDLLFHVQEHHTTPKRLKHDLDALGLRFIGFEGFADAGIDDAYRDAFPADPALTDLGNWEAFEARHGELTDMYLFWCEKPKAGADGA